MATLQDRCSRCKKFKACKWTFLQGKAGRFCEDCRREMQSLERKTRCVVEKRELTKRAAMAATAGRRRNLSAVTPAKPGDEEKFRLDLYAKRVEE